MQTDYYPFGMGMPGRKFSATVGYRYGFNGKGNDSEVKGEGYQQDYGFRIHDPRLGRFLSEDPITAKYPELTPYQFASNRPIDGVDLDGLEWGGGIRFLVAKANAGRPVQSVPTSTSSNNHVGINFQSAMVAKQEYRPSSGYWLADIMLNGDKIGHNAAANVWNGTVQVVEDGTNLVFSSEGRSAVGDKYARGIINMIEVSEKIQSGEITPRELWDDFVKSLKSPEGAENTLSVFYAFLTAKLPSVKLPKFKLNFQFLSNKGISVIGPRTTYREFAKKIGANFLDVTDVPGDWSWSKNLKFLDGVIERGDDVIFAGKFDPSKLDPTSVLADEIKYLTERGYKWTEDFSKLVKSDK